MSSITPSSGSFRPRCALYAFTIYLLTILAMLPFLAFRVTPLGVSGGLFLISLFLSYPVIYAAPSLLLTLAAALLHGRRTRITLVSLAAFFASVTTLLLGADFVLMQRFGFHINGMVLNLVTTPGGIASMGLDEATILPTVLGALVVALLHTGCVLFCFRSRLAAALSGKLYRLSVACYAFAAFAICLLYAIFATGIADFYITHSVLSNTYTLPFTITVRMKAFMFALGFKEPERKAIPPFSDSGKGLNYPLKPIVRSTSRKPVNFIWITCESMRNDLLTPEIMPNTWAFAQQGIRCIRHYSGGHGTRPALFSMFYGLYGLNWDNFLTRRAPVFFDWLLEDNTQFLCQTSADFTYPEFDQTIFASLPGETLRARKAGMGPSASDALLIREMLDFIRKRDTARPFFAFGFLESTHAPYSFPEEGALRKNYYGKINYATVSEKDAPMLYNRYANAAHYIDSLLKPLFTLLDQDKELAENTIVVVCGDHGEEFFEHGRLGHNSTFSNEQVMPFFTMRIPGQAPRVIQHLTHHIDIIPTIAPYLGVTNPPEDYCVGADMLAPEYAHGQFLIAGWKSGAYVDNDYKYILPIGLPGRLRGPALTHSLDDSPCTEEEEKAFLNTSAQKIMNIQKELTRFTER